MNSYGFIPDNNDHYEIEIVPRFLCTDPLLQKKKDLLSYKSQDMSITSKYIELKRQEQTVLHPKLMSALRFVAYEGEDVKELEKYVIIPKRKDLYFKTILIPPLSAANEAKAMIILKDIALRKMEPFSDTLEVDEGILAKEKNLSFNAKNALRLRIGEQKSLWRIVQFAEEMMELLKKPKEVAEKIISEMKAEKTWYKNYAQDTILPLLK